MDMSTSTGHHGGRVADGIYASGLEEDGHAFVYDDSASVLSFDDEDEQSGAVDEYVVLHEEAVTAQRLGVSRNAAEYMKGKAEVATFSSERKWTDEKMFRIDKLLDWVEKEPKIVVDMMQEGRVRARVSAAMGLGKSTKLPLYIANAMQHRVLYVSLDAAAIGQTGTYVKQVGLGRFRALWKTTVQSHVVAMTYRDFNAQAAMDSRADLFKHFETVIFDEAFVEAPMVRAALKQFAVLALPSTNLLMSSANARVDSEQGVKSAGQGNVKVIDSYVSPQAAINSGKLVSDYLTDRTLLILPNDEVVHDVAAYYEGHGVDVRTLDTASRQDELADVCEWLGGDCSTPRVVVAHHRFGIAFNMPVSFMILWPVVTKMSVVDDRVVYEDKPMTEAMVAQALSRLGRGIVDGAGAIVMGSERAVAGETTLAEKVEEYVLLAQSYIRVRDTSEWAGVKKVFPKQLSAAVAQVLRKVNLPAEVAVRFLAEDGRFAAKYSRALQLFAQSDHYIRPSKHELPLGADKWYEEKLFGSSDRGPVVRVPVRANGEVQVVLHAIHALSEDRISIEKWRLPRLTDYNGGSDSEGDDVEGTADVQRRRLRRVRSVKQIEAPRLSLDSKVAWSFSAREVNEDMGGRGTRRGTVLPRDRFTDAMRGMCKVVDNYRVSATHLDYVETSVGVAAEVPLPPLSGSVESPGGTVVCELPGDLCTALNTGQVLPLSFLKELVQAYRTHGRRLVASRLFDCYGHPWTSVFCALMDPQNVMGILRAGLHPMTYDMLGMLGGRFEMELRATVAKSNVFKRTFMKVFTYSPTVDQMMHAINRGKFDQIAQSDAFIDRVKTLKYWYDTCLVVAEKSGVYLPGHVTAAQYTLPIHGSTPLPHQAQGSLAMRPLDTDYYNPRKGMIDRGHGRHASDYV